MGKATVPTPPPPTGGDAGGGGWLGSSGTLLSWAWVSCIPLLSSSCHGAEDEVGGGGGGGGGRAANEEDEEGEGSSGEAEVEEAWLVRSQR